jgi:hypothetical protein
MINLFARSEPAISPQPLRDENAHRVGTALRAVRSTLPGGGSEEDVPLWPASARARFSVYGDVRANYKRM